MFVSVCLISEVKVRLEDTQAATFHCVPRITNSKGLELVACIAFKIVDMFLPLPLIALENCSTYYTW